VRILADRLGLRTAEIRAGRGGERARAITVTTATDGNHGRSVAWGAKMAGCRCRIYVHAQVSEGRAKAMEALGAEVVRIEGNYDDSVRICTQESARNGWQMVSDTSFEGYLEIPRQVMAGYTIMAREAIEQAGEPFTHVFVQAGVGGLAAALAVRLWMEMGENRPRLVIVESEHSPCIMASARRGRATAVKIRHETVMAGMSCGEVSLLAWEIIRRAASHFVTIADAPVPATMRMLASGAAGGGNIEAGECSAAGPLALIAACCNSGLRAAMDLDASARVLLIGTEGATDPAIYREIVSAS